MENIKRDLTDIVNNEAKQFGCYSIFNRAMPHLIDGLKPAQRFFLASCLEDAKTKPAKIASLSGNVSKYGYQHGEVSAGDAGILMCADWSNNINILEGRGNFGSRLVNAAAAQRYVYGKVHDNFDMLFSKDYNQNIKHPDDENKIRQFFIPTIPLILSNGVMGIATGFKTVVLPHSTKWIIKACNEYLTNGKITSKPVVQFPSFTGKVVDNKDGSFTQVGVYKINSPTSITITEIPTNFEWNTYLNHLDKLQDEGKIVRYTDGTGVGKFEFTIILKRGIDSSNVAKMNKLFKLEYKQTQLLNIVAPGDDLTDLSKLYTLKTYDDAKQVIKDFMDWKLKYSLPVRIKNEMDNAKRLSDIQQAKIKFITAVNDNTIDLSKTTKKQLISLSKKLFNIDDEIAEVLARMPIYSLTTDELTSCRKRFKDLQKQYKYWAAETPESQYKLDLSEINLK